MEGDFNSAMTPKLLMIGKIGMTRKTADDGGVNVVWDEENRDDTPVRSLLPSFV